MEKFYSNGKLLLTGEYVVLDGASALAVPTKFGQSLVVEKGTQKGIHWRAYTSENELWANIIFTIKGRNVIAHQDNAVTDTLIHILQAAMQMNSFFLSEKTLISVTTQLDFPNNWGLGSSSTLINNIAQWAKVNAFKLLTKSFGGSGYDIAAAQNNTPITYSNATKPPAIKPIILDWDFKDQLYFVHLNQKQDSKQGVARYKASINKNEGLLSEMSKLTSNIINSKTLEDFITLMKKHEAKIAEVIDLPTVQSQLFTDYKGLVKSLGAWGGDFVLVTATEDDLEYFKAKGYNTILTYSEMVF